MMQESLARKLRVLRAERGITLQEAEELTGVTRETLGALEHGQRGAYTNTLQKIADGYGVTVGELLEEQALTVGKASAPPETGPVPSLSEEVLYREDYTDDFDAVWAEALDTARQARLDYIARGMQVAISDDGESVEVRATPLLPASPEAAPGRTASSARRKKTRKLREGRRRSSPGKPLL